MPPPAIRAALYQAAALIPGTKLVGPQIDPVGRSRPRRRVPRRRGAGPDRADLRPADRQAARRGVLRPRRQAQRLDRVSQLRDRQQPPGLSDRRGHAGDRLAPPPTARRSRPLLQRCGERRQGTFRSGLAPRRHALRPLVPSADAMLERMFPARLGSGFRWLVASSWTANLGDGFAVSAGRCSWRLRPMTPAWWPSPCLCSACHGCCSAC